MLSIFIYIVDFPIFVFCLQQTNKDMQLIFKFLTKKNRFCKSRTQNRIKLKIQINTHNNKNYMCTSKKLNLCRITNLPQNSTKEKNNKTYL